MTNIIEEIISRIPDGPNRDSLISAAFIEREIEVDSGKSVGTIVVLTKRKMTLDGGDGWNGIDGADVEIIRRAVHSFLRDEQAIGFINNIVIREQQAI